MSSALLAALFAILGTGLAATSAACVVLWRRVRALATAGPTSSPLLSGGGGRRRASATGDGELARRVDELADKYRTLEARLAATSGSILSHPAGPRRGRRVDPGSSPIVAGPTLISVPDLAAPPASTSEAAAELDRRFGPVWAMADGGATVDAIAREAGYPIGQVELILGLRRRLLAAEAGPDA